MINGETRFNWLSVKSYLQWGSVRRRRGCVGVSTSGWTWSPSVSGLNAASSPDEALRKIFAIVLQEKQSHQCCLKGNQDSKYMQTIKDKASIISNQKENKMTFCVKSFQGITHNIDLQNISEYLISEFNPIILRYRVWYDFSIHFVFRGLTFHQGWIGSQGGTWWKTQQEILAVQSHPCRSCWSVFPSNFPSRTTSITAPKKHMPVLGPWFFCMLPNLANGISFRSCPTFHETLAVHEITHSLSPNYRNTSIIWLMVVSRSTTSSGTRHMSEVIQENFLRNRNMGLVVHLSELLDHLCLKQDRGGGAVG